MIKKYKTHTNEILLHSITNNNLDLQNIINIYCEKAKSLSWNEKPSEIFDIIEEINSETPNEYLEKVLQNYENTEVLINGCYYTIKKSFTTYYPFFEYFVMQTLNSEPWAMIECERITKNFTASSNQ